VIAGGQLQAILQLRRALEGANRVRECIPRGFSGKGPKGSGLPPRRTLIFSDRLNNRQTPRVTRVGGCLRRAGARQELREPRSPDATAEKREAEEPWN
jgi:hypothetical protein